ncbi:MAG: hypothetical protein V3U75_11610 [Methylococcaceae bacterium]
MSKDLIDALNVKSDFDNFSEEVQILRETSAGSMTLYTVKNKNGVTFQKVPGQPGLENRGFMGFVNGDRARPIMLSGSVRIQESESVDNTGTTLINQGGGGSGSGNGMVDMSPSVAYDIELTASAGNFPDSVDTKTFLIKVG